MLSRISHHFLHFTAPPREVVGENRQQIIQKIALECLTELAATLTIGLAVCSFAPTSSAILLIVSAGLIQTTINIISRFIGAFADDKANQEGPRQRTYRTISDISKIFTPTSFAYLTAINGQTLIHETGHALAAFSLYKDPALSIKINPFLGGNTSYNTSPLGILGTKLGKETSALVVSAAGPAFTLLISSILLGASLQVKEKHPNLSRHLEMSALLDFSTQSSYALSALWASPLRLSHDFVRLSKVGIHPVAAAVAIAAIPILIIATCAPEKMSETTASA